MARYYPVSPQFWTDPTVKAWDDETRLLALYVLTCPHRNLEGLYHLPPLYIEANLGWPKAAIKKAMRRLERDGFLSVDSKSEVVLIRQALKYQHPKSKKQLQGALKALEEVPPNDLRDEFMEACQTFAPEFHDALVNGIDTHSDGSDSEGGES